jgi:hypothetical protein
VRDGWDAERWRDLGFTPPQAKDISHFQTGHPDFMTDREWDDLFDSNAPRDMIWLALRAEPASKDELDQWLQADPDELRATLRMMGGLEAGGA